MRPKLRPPAGSGNSVISLLRVTRGLLRRPVELGPVDPHSVQNDSELSSDGILALRSPLRFASRMPQALSADHFATRVRSTLATS